jgi:hypothetical protein
MTSRPIAIAIAAHALLACSAPAPHATTPAAAPVAPEPQPSEVSGLVVDDDGAAVAHARISAWVPGPGGAQASTVSDDKGRFALELAPGRYSLRADTDATSAGPITVTVDPGRRLDGVTLKLPPIVTQTDIGNFF